MTFWFVCESMRSATSAAATCGVNCAIEIATSPVPGGMSWQDVGPRRLTSANCWRGRGEHGAAPNAVGLPIETRPHPRPHGRDHHASTTCGSWYLLMRGMKP